MPTRPRTPHMARPLSTDSPSPIGLTPLFARFFVVLTAPAAFRLTAEPLFSGKSPKRISPSTLLLDRGATHPTSPGHRFPAMRIVPRCATAAAKLRPRPAQRITTPTIRSASAPHLTCPQARLPVHSAAPLRYPSSPHRRPFSRHPPRAPRLISPLLAKLR